MITTVHIEGLSVCVFDSAEKLLRICMLNSGFDATLSIPHHIQTLALDKPHFRTAQPASLPSIKGRLSPSRFDDLDHEGWDLSGLTVRINGGSGLPGKYQDTLNQEHPTNPSVPDWSALHWVLPFERYLPGCTFPKTAQQVGKQTSAIVEVTGGVCYGGAPTTLGGDANWVWRFNDEPVQQAVTDTMEVRFEKPPTLTFHDRNGTQVGEIVVSDGADIWLINEATDRDLDIERKAFPLPRGHARHLKGYLELLENKPSNLKLPSRVRQWKPEIVEGTFCIVGRVDQ